MNENKLKSFLIVIAIVTLFFVKTVSTTFSPVTTRVDYTFHLGNEDSICADEDSIEIVIGLDYSKPKAYTNIVKTVNASRGKIVNTISIKEKVIAVVADMPLNTFSFFKEKVSKSAPAKYIEPNMKFQAFLVPNDTYWSLQWGPQKIRADWAWNTTTGNSSILVAVIDTGIDYNHPDLAANYVPLGFDWVNNDTDPMDDHGHGTHCAGIIAAALNNGMGIAGLAQVRIMAEKAFNAEGYGWEDDIANAIIHAVEQGAKILSNSWGSYEDSYLIHEVIRYAYNMGLLVAAAAGNEASDVEIYPAAYKEVIAVTATDSDDVSAGFTSFGDWVEIAAPGVDVLSTYLNGSYAWGTGTSMACPHVAGVVALVWSRFPSATRDWVRAQVRYSAEDLGDTGFDEYYGYGRINAENAVKQVPPDHDVLILSWEKPRYIRSGDNVSLNVTIMNFGASDEQNLTVHLLIDGEVMDSAPISYLASSEVTTVNLSWNPTTGGICNLTLLLLPVPGETATENNVVFKMVPVMSIVLEPPSGPVGTKVAVRGVGFDPGNVLTITFNDVILGDCVADEFGRFTFVLNVPTSLAGNQTVKAYYGQNYVDADFTVLDVTPLDVKMGVGAMHFLGETVEFYVQTVFKGQAVNATITSAVLYKPDGSTEDLAFQQVATGLYKIVYTILGNETGTYTLVVAANYTTHNVQANGTSFECFLVSNVLTLMNKQVIEIKDGVATVQTDLGFIKLNLTAINATLENVFLKVMAINGTTATIQTTLGVMNGTITEIKTGTATIATIVVQGLGQIQTDISSLIDTQEAWVIPQYLIVAFTLIAAAGAVLSAVILIKQRKTPKTETG